MTRGSGTWAGALSQFQFTLLSTNKTICFRKQQQKPGTLSQAGISRGDFSISSRICDSARIHQVLYFKTFVSSTHDIAPFTFSKHVPLR